MWQITLTMEIKQGIYYRVKNTISKKYGDCGCVKTAQFYKKYSYPTLSKQNIAIDKCFGNTLIESVNVDTAST